MNQIQLNAGGITGSFGIAQFQQDFTDFISKSNDVISNFKTVTKKTRNTSGGIGDMQDALSGINRRIQLEEKRKTEVESVRTQADEFVACVIAKDKAAAVLVNKNKDAFYKKYPHLQPPPPPDEQAWYEKCWEWLCDGSEKLVQGIKDAWEDVKSWASDVWDSIVDFYLEHKKIIDTILIIVGAVAAIVGVILAGPAALVGLLTALGVSASTAAIISTAVFATAIISTALAAVVNVIDVWMEIDHWLFNSLQNGLNFISAVSTMLIDIGGIFDAIREMPAKLTLKEAGRAKDTYKPNPNYKPGVDPSDLEMVECKVLSDYVPGADEGIDRITNLNHRKFYSVDNVNGGKVYVTVDKIDFRNYYDLQDINKILDNVDGNVNILTGVHGDISGNMTEFNQFFLNDQMHWGGKPNFKVIDVTKLSAKDLKVILNGPDINICNWCFSERSVDVLKALGFM